jgi:hypothetical protein
LPARFARPAPRRYDGGAVRILLVIALIHGLAPDVAEVGEALVHFLKTGHAAHTAEDRGDLGDQGPEHGCGATQHLCACCAAQAVALASPGLAVASGGERPPARAFPPAGLARAVRDPARPFRPPIS